MAQCLKNDPRLCTGLLGVVCFGRAYSFCKKARARPRSRHRCARADGRSKIKRDRLQCCKRRLHRCGCSARLLREARVRIRTDPSSLAVGKSLFPRYCELEFIVFVSSCFEGVLAYVYAPAPIHLPAFAFNWLLKTLRRTPPHRLLLPNASSTCCVVAVVSDISEQRAN